MSMFIIMIMNMFLGFVVIYIDMETDTKTDTDANPLNVKNASKFRLNLTGVSDPSNKFPRGIRPL